MAVKILHPTDPIEVKQLCCLIYGQPGSRKSSLAQTAHNPITLATDPGIYRAYGRKLAVDVDAWADVLEACNLPEVAAASTVNVDTLGMALDKLGTAIIQDNPKHGNRMGGLSLQGYGVLKSQFAQWVAGMKGKGKDLVFIAHEKIEKNGDETYACPDIVGGSYNTLMNIADAVGYMHFDAGKRVIDFAPTDRWMAKVPPCGWGQIVLPDFGKEPNFLANLIAEAKASMGRISAQSAALAGVVEEWRRWLETSPKLGEFNLKIAAEMPKLGNGIKAQAWKLCCDHAETAEWVFEKGPKAFVAKREPGAEG